MLTHIQILHTRILRLSNIATFYTLYFRIKQKFNPLPLTKIFNSVSCSFETHFFVLCFCLFSSTQVILCLFPGLLWLWRFLYSVGPHPLSSLYIYTFVVSRAFMAGAASQAEDADSSQAPDLTSGLQGSVNVHRDALLLVPQWQTLLLQGVSKQNANKSHQFGHGSNYHWPF